MNNRRSAATATEIMAGVMNRLPVVMREAIAQASDKGMSVSSSTPARLAGTLPDGPNAGKRFELDVELRATCVIVEEKPNENA